MNSLKTLLTNPNFIKLWLSQIFSQLTINILNFIIITQIYEKTGSTIALALLWVFYSLPAVFVGPFSGVVIDLWSKRKILFLTNFLQALVVLIYFFNQNHLYLVYLIVFSYSLLNQFYLPAELSSLPWLIKKNLFPVANSLFLFTSQIAFLLGFGSGGVFIKFFGRNFSVLLAIFLLFLASIITFILPKEKKKEETYPLKSKIDALVKKLVASWQFLRKKGQLILYSFVFLALFQAVAGSLGVIFPAFSLEVLNRPFTDTSLSLILPVSLGLIIGSWWFSRSSQKRKKHWIVTGIFIAAASLIALSLVSFLSLSFREKLFLIITLLFILGGASALIFVPSQTFIQETTPPSIRGRIFGLMSVIINLGTIPPILLVATVIDILGVKSFLLIIGGGAFFLALFLHKKSDEIIILAANHRS